MKKLSLTIICALCLISCTETKKKDNTKNQGAMAQSVGKINELSVIVDDELWKGAVGDTIRKYFGAEVPGLPQEEPLFSMRQMPEKAFSGFARKNRTFLKIQKGKAANFTILKNKYANPQIGAVISGKTNEEIISVIQKNSETIILKYKLTETREKQKRIKKSLEKIPQLTEKMGIKLNIPTAYRIALEEEKFFWIRKDIPQGSMNLMIYELPLGTITKDSNTVSSIIKMRDSIGAIKIPTSAEGKFMTEKAYAPYLFETRLNGKFTFETKGTWEIKDRFMAGPFVNYAIEDKTRNRLLVLEGFVFAPSINKRDNMFELEAIMKTVKFE
ncbi:DUF4837 family protein [Aquimarina sp. 2201CG5-10]|uniref:DUF4837 family protein n=1 Tax=Aquimarina callyspongiae TaxID=3098150 RepID=UPI002AB43A39|nr:DUF4837 family protein [Aquimarina sp. 2201CG5-10]MDY8138655.1 DUF4837 family protein [Aquimarina sp. 2201CG5-10]